MTKLQASNWVLVLCSGAACTSAFVNQEVGGALATSKHLVPIVWDINPSELPGWLSQFQVLDLRNSTLPYLKQQVAAIADQIKQEKAQGWAILGALALLILLGSKE